MPGHAHAAIKAMESRYRRLLPLGEAAASQYLLSDQEDRSKYLSIQYFRDNAINPCLTSTYNFISKVNAYLFWKVPSLVSQPIILFG